MDYTEEAVLKAFLYRINCGLLFDTVTNFTGLNLSLDTMYSKKGVYSRDESSELLLVDDETRITGEHGTIVIVFYKNNQLIIKEYGNK